MTQHPTANDIAATVRDHFPTVEPEDQLLADIFTTALEGGINYWASVLSYHWSDDAGTPDLFGFTALVTNDADDDAPRHTIDRAVIARGWRLARSTDWHGRIRWSAERPPVVFGDDSDWDFDADDADVIVQLGLFGEPVYG